MDAPQTGAAELADVRGALQAMPAIAAGPPRLLDQETQLQSFAPSDATSSVANDRIVDGVRLSLFEQSGLR